MRKMVAQMINSSKIHELITYSANVLLSTLSPVNMRATLLRFIDHENIGKKNYKDINMKMLLLLECAA